MRARLLLRLETIRLLALGPVTNSAVGCPPSIGCPQTQGDACLTKVNCTQICNTVLDCTNQCGGGGGGGTHTGTLNTDCACTVQTQEGS